MSLYTLTYVDADDGCDILRLPTRLAASKEDYVIHSLLEGDVADDVFYNFLEQVVFANLPDAGIETIIATGYDAHAKAVDFLDARTKKTYQIPVAKLMKRIDRAQRGECGSGGCSLWLLSRDDMASCPTRWSTADPTTPTKRIKLDAPEIDLTCHE